MNRLKQQYHEQVVPVLQKDFNKPNVFAVARLEKIVINVGIGKEAGNREQIAKAVAEQISQITGQKAQARAARISIAGFKIRQGEPVGVSVTLRGERMWVFFDKLVSVVLPQVKDFSGVSRTAFDQSGSYSLGLKEQIIFPEIVYDEIDKVRGMQITFTVRNASSQAESMEMLEKLGMPFTKTE